MANLPGKHDAPGAPVLERKPKIARAPRYAVIFYNDDYTSKWFVVDVLMRFFHMTEASSTAFMLIVHRMGKGVAGVYTRDIAETKAHLVMEHARTYEMPLLVTAELAEDEEP